MYRAYLLWMLILLAILSCLATLICTGQKSEARVTGWNENIETLARGVDAWCSSVQTIEGNATAQVYVSEREIASQKRADDVERQSPGERPHYTTRGLYICRFFIAPDEWWTELAEVVPTGANHWGMAINVSRGKDLSEIGTSKGCPISYSIGDRERVILYNAAIGYCRVTDYQTKDSKGQPMSSIKASLLLTASNVPLGDALLKLIHSKYSDFPTKLVLLVKGAQVAGAECWKILIYFQTSPDNLIRYSVWIAPDRGYMPMAFESLLVDKDQREKGMRHYYKVTVAKEFNKGIWIATESTYHAFVYESGRKENWYRGYHVYFTNLQLNEAKPSFTSVPPLGTLVEDLRSDVMTQRQLGGLDGALKRFKAAPLLEPEPSMDGPLSGNEFNEVFPPH